MEQKNRTRIALLIAIVVVAAVFGSFGYSLFSTRTPAVTLPSLQPDSSNSTSSPSESDPAARVEVTTDTVQAVIASLDRADSYYRQLDIETTWSDGSGVTTVYTWVDGGCTYVRSSLPGGQIRYALTVGNIVYYWYDGSTAWLTAPAGSLSADLAQSIPTYEDVLALPTQTIADAGYVSYEGEPCIYVVTRLDELGYMEYYWISVDNGLLIGSETRKGDALIYSMRTSGTIQTPCPTDVVFALPDGTVLHSF